ncbi:Glutathione S-transferase C-terminal-like protein [Dioscorea alata]|uniref:Glutathione S-transferase C-terminal-like protein n=2 Tax=Dioscorea alata TaxID=55571 RepID=A0ACB7U1T6_DIOAL|nr:Glutathione S-transferase C-terminal-like protein [Dioscorea alata]KAH7654290.1 Glutathione S-transferase C-terminal-like protein [Dioscorea alata]
MVAMVARGSSPLPPSISIQEKGSRNKRKFRAEPPPSELSMLPPAVQSECSSYELASVEKALGNLALEHHPVVCDLCNSFAYGHDRELESNEFQDADWGNITEAQLEEMLLNNLDLIFRTAIKSIASYGYSEEVASNAVLVSGICYGYKDFACNIVDKALEYLKSGHEVESSLRETFNEDLHKLEKTVLADMVGVLKEVQPFLSIGDAMWCLLICDMDVATACSMEGELLSILGNDETSGASTALQQSESESNSNISAPVACGFDRPGSKKRNASLPFPHKTQQLITMPSAGVSACSNVHGTIPNLGSWKESKIVSPALGIEESTTLSMSQPYARFSSHLHSTSRKLNPGKENPTSDQNFTSLALPQPSFPEQKPASSRNSHVSSSKRDSALRQKSTHAEKNYRAFAKAALRSGKHSNFGGLMLDKKCRSLPDSASINLKSASLKISKVVGTNRAQTDAMPSLSFSAGSSASLPYNVETVSHPTPLNIANTDLSLSLPSASTIDLNAKSNCFSEVASYSDHTSITSGGLPEDSAPLDKKDEELLKLVPAVRDLQAELQEWNDWAQQKVMQATRRLTKDRSELQTLRQEKEEVGRLRKEKQSLEENTVKKLSEMENALSKAGGQVDRANDAMHRLEVENSALRQQMEAAKLRAAQSAASCQEVSRREMETLKKVQLCEKEMSLLQEELASVKRKLSQLRQHLEQEKDRRDQLEVNVQGH